MQKIDWLLSLITLSAETCTIIFLMLKYRTILTLLLLAASTAEDKKEASADNDPLQAVLGLDQDLHEELHKSASEHSYTVETDRTLSILVNRLYKGDRKFLRELLSNARDALTKMRHEIVRSMDAEESVFAASALYELEVRVSVDKDKEILTVRDNGIGMSAQELHTSLGRIAASGTAKAGGKLADDLVGMFGVGFYSAFMAADTVIVVTKSFRTEEPQMVWRSNPLLKKEFVGEEEGKEPNYFVYKDPRGNTLGRGTEIHLHLKKDAAAQKFLDIAEVKKALESFSQFSDLAVWVLEDKEREVEVPMSEEEIAEEKRKEEEERENKEKEKEKEKEGEEEEDSSKEETKEEEKEEKKYVKKEKEQYKEWTKLDIVPAIWERSKESVTKEEYLKFFRKLLGRNKGKDAEYSKVVHVRVESQNDFSAILFVPKKPLDSQMPKGESNVAVFVRSVLVARKVKGLLPKHFGFVVGAVNASKLSLNVDRESL